MLMKRLMNWRPLVKSLFLLSLHYTFVTRRWKDLSLFHYWVQHFPTWFPLAIFVIIFTHIDNLLQLCKNFIILASFDAYKTVKATEISFRKAFAYSEHIKRKLYCLKKKKFVPKRERHWIIKLLELYCTKKKKGTGTWVKVQKKGSKYNYVAMVTDNLNWWLSAIKLSTLFLHLTFAVRIKFTLPQEPP